MESKKGCISTVIIIAMDCSLLFITVKMPYGCPQNITHHYVRIQKC